MNDKIHQTGRGQGLRPEFSIDRLFELIDWLIDWLIQHGQRQQQKYYYLAFTCCCWCCRRCVWRLRTCTRSCSLCCWQVVSLRPKRGSCCLRWWRHVARQHMTHCHAGHTQTHRSHGEIIFLCKKGKGMNLYSASSWTHLWALRYGSHSC